MKLRDAQAFTRGFLLAMGWANSPPRPKLEDRVPRLAGEDIPLLYGALRALPPASRQAMRITWTKREPLQRIDDRVELHASWMTELLRNEPASTLLLTLGELQPEMGRDVLRALWPQVRPAKPEDSVGEMKPLQPALAGHLRRRLFSNFVRLSDTESDRGQFAPLLELNPAELWLLSQELGRNEMAGAASPEDAKRLQEVQNISSSKDEVVGLLGLRVLATTLAEAPRRYCSYVAQKMAQPIAQHLLRWRDTDNSNTSPNEQSAKEVFKKVDSILNRRRTDTRSE